MSLGSLRVILGLDAAEFTRGLTKAEQEAQKFQRGMVNVGKTIGTALGATLSAGAFIAMIKGAIDAADRLNDLSKQTGVAVTTLGGLGFAATQAGGDLDSTVEALGKLNKTIAEADAGNKDSLEFFQKLGISVRDSSGQIKDAGAVYLETADKFSKFADGPNKAALALRGFGKAGQAQIPVLNEGAEALRQNIDYWKQYSGITEESARKADEFNDTLGRLGVITRSLGQKIAENLLPFLQVLGNEFQKAGEEGQSAFDQIGKGFSNFFRNIAIAGVQIKYTIGTVLQDLDDFKAYMDQFFARNAAAAKAIREGASARGEAAREAADRQTRALASAVPQKPLQDIGLENLEAALRKPANRKPDAPGLRGGGADKAAQEQKKLLDKQLSDIDNFIKAEKRALETRESDLERLYKNDQISTAAYFDERIAALNQHTNATVDAYNKQIKAQEAFAAASRKRKDEPAAIDAERKIGDIQARIADVLHEKQQRELNLRDDLTQAAQAYADQIDEVRARVLELIGTEKAALEAAKLRFDIQNRPAIQAAKREQNPALAADLAALRAQSDAQTQINNLLKDAGVIEQNLATAQAKLHLERDLGMRDEIDSYKALASSSTDAAAKLQVIADKYLAIARADGSAVLIANAEAFKQKVTELAAATDILAAQFRKTFVDTGASAIETFLNNLAEGKNALDSFKEAFKQFANDIIRQINRIAAQKIADSLFKSGGSGGEGGVFSGLADLFVKYIGGLGGAEQGGPVAGRTAYVVGERGPEIFVPQTVAAEASKQIDSLIAQRGKPAEYNGEKVAAIAANLPHMIGAKGPEIFVPKTSGIVIPNDKVTKLAAVLEKQKQAPSVKRETILREEKIIKRYANAPRDRYISAKAIEQRQRAVASLAPRQRRASGGHVTASTPYIVGELGPELFMPKEAGRIIKNEKAIDALISNTTQRKNINRFNNENSVTNKNNVTNQNNVTIDRLVSNIERTTNLNATQAVKKIINVQNAFKAPAASGFSAVPERVINNNKFRELISKQQNDKTVINNLKKVEKTTSELLRPLVVDGASKEKIINNLEISKLISKTVTNNLRSVEKTSELLRPTPSKIIKSELSEFVSNIQNNQTTNESVQARANGGPVSAYQTYLVGERGAEVFVPRDISVPSDFFTSDSYRRARGGMVNANRPYIVGERGPEMFVPKTAGQIVTNNRIGGANTTNININVPSGTNAATANQIAAAVSRQMAISNARYN